MKDTPERAMAEAESRLDMADNRIKELEGALRFCRDIADEELAFVRVGTGAEVALRHISNKARQFVRDE